MDQRTVKRFATTVSALITGSERRTPLTVSTEPVYWSFSSWLLVMSVFLMLAPNDYFGSSWHFFNRLPTNGFWLGLCLFWITGLLIIGLWKRWSRTRIAVLIFLVGLVFWTCGMLLLVAGLAGHQGLLEAPFILSAGTYSFVHSAFLMARKGKE
jgi:hypothetical protein